MYINELKIKLLKIRNGILLFIGIAGLIIFGLSIVATLLEFNYYDYNYVITLLFLILISILAICFSIVSRKTIDSIYFLSRYFEGSLDDIVKFSHIAESCNIKEEKVKSMVKRFIRKKLMKNYTVDEERSQIKLSSKTYQCECKNCGAIVDKKEYFTGTCSYCGSSDLFAKVITENRCYNIVNETEGNILIKGSKKNKYLNKNILLKRIGIITLIFIDIVICLTSIIILPFTLVDYSAAAFGFFLSMFIAFGFLSFLRFSNFKYIEPAMYYSKIFNDIGKPFVDVDKVPKFKFNRQETSVVRFIRRKTMLDTKTNIIGGIKKGYLVNCTVEFHDGRPQVVLAKKIVKDTCPNCGAPIVGAVDEVYKCSYCGNKIFDVIEKK